MTRAYIALRNNVKERIESVMDGCRSIGLDPVHVSGPVYPARNSICIAWNRHLASGTCADAVEREGGRVIVMENGYCGKDSAGRQYYALARDQHLGAGRWFPQDDDSRWRALGIELKPWRTAGTHILVCESRGFGSARTQMPNGWRDKIRRELQTWTSRPIRFRSHPAARGVSGVCDLADDLKDAHAVVIWASNAGTAALIAGVPVVACFGQWLLQGACGNAIQDVDRPNMPDRRPAFVRLSWAQWTLDEIATGFPIARLLES